jgi:hypothetical protein
MSASPSASAAGRLHLVVAFDQVGGIGKDGTIPWVLPPDLKRFKELTTSLPKGVSPGSFNVVIMVNNLDSPTFAAIGFLHLFALTHPFLSS